MLITFEANYHHRYIHEILDRYKMTGSIEIETFVLTIRYGDYGLRMLPQFQIANGEYSPVMTSDTKRFIGWRPYDIKSWDVAGDKMRFKKLLAKNNILHPWATDDPNVVETGVVVKKKVSSFGIGMRGPYRSTMETQLNQQEGEFFDQYISGTIAKIWFWNKDAVAAEVVPPVSVIGNGIQTISDLILAKAEAFNVAVNPAEFEQFIQYQGLTLQTVLPDQQRCQIDYLYKSKLPSKRGYDVRIGEESFFGLEPQLAHIGNVMVENFPGEMGPENAYVIDGVIDRAGQLWVLELNTNPFVHPYVYEPMIESWRKTVS